MRLRNRFPGTYISNRSVPVFCRLAAAVVVRCRERAAQRSGCLLVAARAGAKSDSRQLNGCVYFSRNFLSSLSFALLARTRIFFFFFCCVHFDCFSAGDNVRFILCFAIYNFDTTKTGKIEWSENKNSGSRSFITSHDRRFRNFLK